MMLIINADDFGRSAAETKNRSALRCYQAGRITSVSAMVFMVDSERAAQVANANGLEVGLHLNFSDPFTDGRCPERLRDCHNRIVMFLKKTSTRRSCITPYCEKNLLIGTMRKRKNSCAYLGQPPHTLTGIITCTFARISCSVT